MTAEFTERDIHLALDGELPAERLNRPRAERRLEAVRNPLDGG